MGTIKKVTFSDAAHEVAAESFTSIAFVGTGNGVSFAGDDVDIKADNSFPVGTADTADSLKTAYVDAVTGGDGSGLFTFTVADGWEAP
jgi:hypothetical protein